MQIITIDFESFWDTDHSLAKMSPVAYVMHPQTEIISMAIKVDDNPTDVVFGEDNIRATLRAIDWSDTMVIGHNMSGFDSMILAWRFGVKPKMWGCTLAMARPLHAKTVGLGLGKLVAHYGLGVKDQAVLMQTKGRHLCDFTPQELVDMRTYNKADTEQCYALFHELKPHYSAKELWHIDATIRMLVEPKFEVNVPMLEAALCMERDQKRKHVLMLARHLRTSKTVESSAAISKAKTLDTLEEAVRVELASAPKFAALLESLGAEVPMKDSPSDPGKQIPALAKTDEGFIALQESDDELVAAAARARLAVKSTILETRIQAFLDTAAVTNGKIPFPLNYCGADTTGRWSGFLYNPQNMPRVSPGHPKVSDALRNCMKAPKGHMVVVADLSGIELRVNHFLWQVPSTMALYQDKADADLYRAAGAITHNCTPEEVTKEQRQVEKIKALGLGFGAGWSTFMKVAKAMGGLSLTEEESRAHVVSWRGQYLEIVFGWRTCHERLQDIRDGVEAAIDPWGLMTTCPEGIRGPSGRIIRYPGLHTEPDGKGRDEWWYGTGRHRARIYTGKIDENICQFLARDILADNMLEVYKQTGLRPVGHVHDELIYIAPESEAQALLDTVQSIMRTPPKWWPGLITWSEGSVGNTYGAAK